MSILWFPVNQPNNLDRDRESISTRRVYYLQSTCIQFTRSAASPGFPTPGFLTPAPNSSPDSTLDSIRLLTSLRSYQFRICPPNQSLFAVHQQHSRAPPTRYDFQQTSTSTSKLRSTFAELLCLQPRGEGGEDNGCTRSAGPPGFTTPGFPPRRITSFTVHQRTAPRTYDMI